MVKSDRDKDGTREKTRLRGGSRKGNERKNKGHKTRGKQIEGNRGGCVAIPGKPDTRNYRRRLTRIPQRKWRVY